MRTEVGVLSLVLAVAGASACAQPKADGPASPPAAAPSAAGQAESADALLNSLETADKDLHSLQAQVKYMRDYGPLEPSKDQWLGTLSYRVKPAAAPGESARKAFSVDFTKKFVNGQERDEEKVYVFDGQYLVEKDVSGKQIVRQAMAPPGKVASLRIDDGPFPIPVGQKKSEMLERFTIEMVAPEQSVRPDEVQPWMKETYQLRLVPKAGTSAARDFQEIRVWYRKADLLPRMAKTVNTDGGTSEVLLVNLEKDKEIPDQVFDTALPAQGSGWSTDDRPFRQAADSTP